MPCVVSRPPARRGRLLPPLLGAALAMLLAAPPAWAENAAELAQRARTAYQLGRFEQAAKLYEQAYELDGKPSRLFNLGQCYRLLKNYERAIFFYNRYLSVSPGASNRAQVEGLIRELERLVEEGRKASARPPTQVLPGGGAAEPSAGAAVPASAPSTDEAYRPWYRRWYVWAIVGAVVVGGAVGGAVAATRGGSSPPSTDLGHRSFGFALGGRWP